jgi:hypothetical protein
LAVGSAVISGVGSAQVVTDGHEHPAPAVNTALAWRHWFVADLLDRADAVHGLVLAAAAMSPSAELDASTYRAVLNQLLEEAVATGEAPPPSEGPQQRPDQAEGAVPPLVHEMMARAQVLRADIYDIYADDGLPDKAPMVEAATDRYLADTALAVPAAPKSMEVMDAQAYSKAFRTAYPHLNGFMWAQHWLQLAVLENLVQPQSQEKRQASLFAVVARFWDMLEGAPLALPVQMPMAPTIARALTREHPRAAAIFDNIDMMHDIVADILVNPIVVDKRGAIEQAVRDLRDPRYLPATFYDWNRMAIIHGVDNQGGWPTDIMARPPHTEVNTDHFSHLNHGGSGCTGC